jgi:hypothetical protein
LTTLSAAYTAWASAPASATAARSAAFRSVVRERRVLGHRGDDAGDPLAESGPDLVDPNARVLDRIVEQSGGHDLVVEAAAAEQGGDLEWVQDELGAVDLSHLARVQFARPPERLAASPRQRADRCRGTCKRA